MGWGGRGWVEILHLTSVSFLTLQYIMGVLDARYNWICQPVIYSYEPEHMRVSACMCTALV